MAVTVERWSFPANVVVSGKNKEDAFDFAQSLLDDFLGITLAEHGDDGYEREARLYIDEGGEAWMEDYWEEDE